MHKLKRERTTGKEQYYTLPEIADLCYKILTTSLESDLIEFNFLEPAAGTGEFIEALKRAGVPKRRIQAWDIEPKHPDIQATKDFLQENIHLDRPAVVLTNPPFGRAHSLSVKFFNKCAPLTDVIAFITTKAWRKWSIQNKLDRNFHLISDTALPSVCFYDGEGVPHTGEKLQPIFQIWKRSAKLRETQTADDRGYITKVKPKYADVALTIFGRSCGRVETKFDKVPNTTKMFLKVKNKRKVTQALKSIDYTRFCKNVSYTEALSIKEIFFLLNEYFDNKGK